MTQKDERDMAETVLGLVETAVDGGELDEQLSSALRIFYSKGYRAGYRCGHEDATSGAQVRESDGR